MSQGAAMLYLATNTSQYLTDAEAYFKRGPAWGQSWGNKFTGCMVNFTFFCLSSIVVPLVWKMEI